MAAHIRDSLSKFLDKKKEEFKEQEKVLRIVNGFLDKETRKNLRFKGVFKKELLFVAGSSSLSYNFRLKKDKVLEAVQKEFPLIKGIKIEIG